MSEMRFGRKRTESEQAELKPIPFTLEGTGVLDGKDWEESFSTVPLMPAGALDALTRSVSVRKEGGRERVEYDQLSILRWFYDVIVPDDLDRFDQLVHDKNRVVELETLGDAMRALSEAMSGVPTRVPSD